MYTIKKSPKKRLTPVRGRKARIARFKKILFAAAAAAFLVLAALGLNKLSAVLFEISGPEWARWRIKEIKITGATPEARYEVLKYVGFDTGDHITARDAANLEDMLQSSLKQFSDISVRRGWFDGQLKIKVKEQTPLARIITEDKTFLLAPSGAFFADDGREAAAALLPVYVKDKGKSDFLPQELVKLIKALGNAGGIDGGQRVSAAALDMGAKTFSLQLGEDTAFADMGGFADYARKTARLGQVIREARARGLRQPYDINFNYYEDGKIYLKQSI
ncbi:MAG: FtsQ-type POTRA domain-containing protein [Elusimicrobiota bacterium]|nr:FtsQ-type POTRA domain-containing protein [Elusimicrobiota bacterium]